MITPFRTTTSGLTAQPSTEKLIIRSTSAADTSQTLTASGTVSASPDTDAISLLGQREVEGAKVFSAITAALLSAAAAGTVTIRGQGTKGQGLIIVTDNPVDGDTVLLGLDGFTQTYTFRAKAQFTIQTLPVSGITQGDYFDIAVGATTYRYWFDIDAAGTGAPSGTGVTLTMVSIATGDTADDVATTLEVAMESTITGWTCSVSADTVTAEKDILAAETLTFTDGTAATGFTYTEVSLGTADAANQIAIGATASDTADNLNRAINDSGTEGTHYGTGTVANVFLTSTVSGTILTVTDKIACDRYLDWSFTQTGTGLSLSVPIGGVDGSLLVTIAAGDTARTSAISLDDEALALDLLPALTTFVSDWLKVNGKNCTLYLAAENVASAITASYEVATDTGYPVPGVTSLTGLDNNRYAITPAESGIEWIRLTLANTNSAAASVNAKMVTG